MRHRLKIKPKQAFKETVYLDSSDISRFAEVAHGRPRASIDSALYDAAVAAVDAGAAVFPLSMVHMGEALRHSPMNASGALERATVMEKLAAGWSYPTLNQLLDYDILFCVEQKFGKSLQSEGLLDIEHRWSWVPSFEKILETEAGGFAEKIRNELESKSVNSSRNQRRLLTKSLANLSATSESRRSLINGFEAELGHRFSFFEHPDLIPVLLGKCSARRIQSSMELELGRPTSVVALANKGERLSDIAYRPVAAMQEALAKLIESLISNLAAAGYTGDPSQRELWRRTMSEMQLDVAEKLFPERKSIIFDRGFTEEVAFEDLDFSLAPHNSLLSNIAIQYALDHTENPAMARRQRPSDAGDLFHLVYAPRSTIWMGDRYSTELARRVVPKPPGLLTDREELLVSLRDAV